MSQSHNRIFLIILDRHSKAFSHPVAAVTFTGKQTIYADMVLCYVDYNIKEGGSRSTPSSTIESGSLLRISRLPLLFSLPFYLFSFQFIVHHCYLPFFFQFSILILLQSGFSLPDNMMSPIQATNDSATTTTTSMRNGLSPPSEDPSKSQCSSLSDGENYEWQGDGNQDLDVDRSIK